MLPYEIIYDEEYTAQLRAEVAAKFANSGPRAATHLSDLLYCLDGESRVLTAGLRWVRLDELSVGDELIGFDEKRSRRQCFRPATVTGITRVELPAYRIRLDDGREVIASGEHLWLARRGHRPAGVRAPDGSFPSLSNGGCSRAWVRTDALTAGDAIGAMCQPWEAETGFAYGWLSGLFDGEGCVNRNQAFVSQNPGPVLERARVLLDTLGFTVSEAGARVTRKLMVTGPWASWQVLGMLRPIRLIENFKKMWNGQRIWNLHSKNPEVVSVDPVGVRSLVSIGTSTGTLIVEGLYSHNCLLKAWGKQHLPVEEWNGDADHPEDEGDPLLSWLQGLQFEDLVSKGQRQPARALCFKCNVVSVVGTEFGPDGQPRERTTCSVCGERWLIATPDFIVDEIVHESKQTRKSQRRGPQDAPWWIEQVAGYVLFRRIQAGAARDFHRWSRLVVNWLMGDYGSRKKGKKPRPPRSALDAFKVVFPSSDAPWQDWQEELRERKRIIEGPDRPPLDMVRSPRYPQFECASCPVGKPLRCPAWIWDDEGNETFPFGVPGAPQLTVATAAEALAAEEEEHQ